MSNFTNDQLIHHQPMVQSRMSKLHVPQIQKRLHRLVLHCEGHKSFNLRVACRCTNAIRLSHTLSYSVRFPTSGRSTRTACVANSQNAPCVIQADGGQEAAAQEERFAHSTGFRASRGQETIHYFKACHNDLSFSNSKAFQVCVKTTIGHAHGCT